MGETITVEISARAEASAAISGEIVFQSSSRKRTLEIPLTVSNGKLTGRLTVIEGMESGTWRFHRLLMTNAHLENTLITNGVYTDTNKSFRPAFFDKSFTVEAGAPDNSPPELKRLAWSTPTAVAGLPARISAEVSDSAGDTVAVRATVSQEGFTGLPLWEHEVLLLKKASGLWEGAFFTPVGNFPEGTVRVSRVTLLDRTGNFADLRDPALAAVQPAALILTDQTIPQWLNTEPFLVNVIHRGSYSFLDWNKQDIDMVADLYDQLESDPEAFRSAVRWQILTLLDHVKALRQEVYTDPSTRYRFVPLNTSGKWWALDKAFQARLFMLEEAARREGPDPASTLTREGVMLMASLGYDSGDYLTPLDPAGYAQTGPRLMASVLDTLRQSSLPPNLMDIQHRAPSGDEVSLLDRDLIWFMPFSHSSALAQHYDNGREILLFLAEQATPEELVHSFFHELGHHFSEAFSDPILVTHRDSWADYVKLRKASQWMPTGGWAARPQENVAEDFAYAFLPGDLKDQYRLRGSYPALSENPDMLAAFTEWAAKLTKRAPEPPPGFSGTERIMITSGPIKGQFIAGKNLAYAVKGETIDLPTALLTFTKVGSDGTFSLPLPAGRSVLLFMRIDFEQAPEIVERTFLYQNWGQEPVYETATIPRRVHQRLVAVLPWPISASGTAPRSTNSAEIALVSGKVQGRLLIDGLPADRLTLKPGENLFSVQIVASDFPFRMSVPIFYEPAATPALSASAPATVGKPETVITGRTEPLSIVRAAGSVTASDKLGRYTLTVRGLKAGQNQISVSIVTPGGNEATKTLSVSYSAPRN